MRKSLLFFIFGFILVFSAKVWAGDYYFIGIDCFKKGLYDKATKSLETAIKINPKNINARYYLAQSYLKQKRIYEAKNQYNRIIVLAPTSDAAILSKKGLSLIQQSYLGSSGTASIDALAKYKDNYLDFVLTSDGEIVKWPSFPLTVYIQPIRQKDLAKKAFIQWQEKSENLVSFNFIDSPEKAQITVEFDNNLESSSTKDSYIAGYSKPYYQDDKIIKSDISILVMDPSTKITIDDNSVYFAILHEIGHSLGFRGHSSSQNDIMYGQATTPKLNLTQRDINTLNMFYKINSKSLLARGKGSTDVKLQQATAYVKASPDKAVGWANLGDIYRGKKMYSEAIKNYKKAITIEPNKAELYNLLGNTYLAMNDKKNAYETLKKTCDLDKSNPFYLEQFAQVCTLTNQKPVGRNYVEAYLKANPKEISNPKLQNILKLL